MAASLVALRKAGLTSRTLRKVGHLWGWPGEVSLCPCSADLTDGRSQTLVLKDHHAHLEYVSLGPCLKDVKGHFWQLNFCHSFEWWKTLHHEQLFSNRLHHQLTFSVFLIACSLTTMSQLFGEPIYCIVEGVPTNMFQAHCWSSGTFTLPHNPHTVSAYPGVSPYIPPYQHRPYNHQYQSRYQQRPTHEEEVKYHSYYQWVGLFLFLQAVFSSVPWYLWHLSEGGKVKIMVQGLRESLMDEETRKEQVWITMLFTKAMFWCKLFLDHTSCQILRSDSWNKYWIRLYFLHQRNT